MRDGVFHTAFCVPVSRILYPVISLLAATSHGTTAIYLGQRSLAASSGTLLLLRNNSTALHPGKDFAVSFLHHCKTHPTLRWSLWLSPRTFLLAPLGLPPTGVTCYPAPPIKTEGSVRTFLPKTFCKAKCSGSCPARSNIIPYKTANR